MQPPPVLLLPVVEVSLEVLLPLLAEVEVAVEALLPWLPDVELALAELLPEVAEPADPEPPAPG